MRVETEAIVIMPLILRGQLRSQAGVETKSLKCVPQNTTRVHLITKKASLRLHRQSVYHQTTKSMAQFYLRSSRQILEVYLGTRVKWVSLSSCVERFFKQSRAKLHFSGARSDDEILICLFRFSLLASLRLDVSRRFIRFKVYRIPLYQLNKMIIAFLHWFNFDECEEHHRIISSCLMFIMLASQAFLFNKISREKPTQNQRKAIWHFN